MAVDVLTLLANAGKACRAQVLIGDGKSTILTMRSTSLPLPWCGARAGDSFSSPPQPEDVRRTIDDVSVDGPCMGYVTEHPYVDLTAD